jgi:DNA-binding winged helix-turn-helix (wHTH) protein
VKPATNWARDWRIGTALLLLLLAAGIGTWRTTETTYRIVENALDQAFLSSSAFAQAAMQWIAHDDWETVDLISGLMLAGGTRAIRIMSDQWIMLERESAEGILDQGLGSSDPGEELLARRLVRTSAGWFFDIRIPCADPAGRTISFSTLLDASSTRSQIVTETLETWGLVGAAWMLAQVAVFAVYRVRNRSSSCTPQSDDRQVNPFVVCPDSRRIRLYGRPIALTPKQFELISLLASRRGAVVTEREILTVVWPRSTYADSNDIRQCIYKIRRRLAIAYPGAEASLVNEKGFGYRIAIDRLPGATSIRPEESAVEDQEKGE